MAAGDLSPGKRRRPLALLVFLVTFAAAGTLLLERRPLADLGGAADEWFMLGVNLRLYHTLGLESHPILFRPPGYPLFIAGVLAATDALRQSLGLPVLLPPRPEPVYFAQCLVLGLSASMMFLWIAAQCDEWIALVSALLFGLNPYSLMLTGLLHYDVLHIFFLIATGMCLQRSLLDPDKDRASLLRAGVVAGLATLVRPLTLMLPPFVLLLFLVRSGFSWRRSLGSAVLFTLAVGVVVAPWTARNYVQAGRLVPVNAQAWAGIWGSTVVKFPMSPDRSLWSSIANTQFMPIYRRVTGMAEYQYGAFIRYNDELELAFRTEVLSNLRRQPQVYLHNVLRSFLTMTLQINAVFIKVFQYSQQPGVNVSQLYHQPAPLADYPSRTAAGFSWLVRLLSVLAGVGLWHGLSTRAPLALAAGALYLCASLAHALTYMDLMYYYVKLPFLFAFAALGLAAVQRWQSRRAVFGRPLRAAQTAAALLLGFCVTLTISLLF